MEILYYALIFVGGFMLHYFIELSIRLAENRAFNKSWMNNLQDNQMITDKQIKRLNEEIASLKEDKNPGGLK